MEIDTNTIRHLRNALLASGQAEQSPEGGPAGAARSDSMSHPSERRISPFVETIYLMTTSKGEMGATEHAVIRGALTVLTRGL